jgi:hypothetical protein
MSRTSRAEWAKRVQRWADSGLTAKEFAAEAGLNASTLSYWKWRLSSKQQAPERSAVSGTPRRATRRTVSRASAPTFMEVTPSSASVASPLELVLRDDVTLRVPVGFDEETLTRVLRLVGAPS